MSLSSAHLCVAWRSCEGTRVMDLAAQLSSAVATSFTQAGAFHLISLIRSQRLEGWSEEGRREGKKRWRCEGVVTNLASVGAARGRCQGLYLRSACSPLPLPPDCHHLNPSGSFAARRNRHRRHPLHPLPPFLFLVAVSTRPVAVIKAVVLKGRKSVDVCGHAG